MSFVSKMTRSGLKSQYISRILFDKLFYKIAKMCQAAFLTFWTINFEPVEIQKRTICQNMHSSLVNVVYSMLFVSKMTRSSLKLTTYK